MKVKRNIFGRGVYATRNYKAGAIVERAHVIILPRSETFSNEPNSSHILPYYVFQWDMNSDAIGLGNASLYNHCKRPNLFTDVYANQLIFTAARNIKKGEQLTINYGYEEMLSKDKAKFARGEIG